MYPQLKQEQIGSFCADSSNRRRTVSVEWHRGHSGQTMSLVGIGALSIAATRALRLFERQLQCQIRARMLLGLLKTPTEEEYLLTLPRPIVSRRFRTMDSSFLCGIV